MGAVGLHKGVHRGHLKVGPLVGSGALPKRRQSIFETPGEMILLEKSFLYLIGSLIKKRKKRGGQEHNVTRLSGGASNTSV